MALFYAGWWGLILLVLSDYSLILQLLATKLALAGNLVFTENLSQVYQRHIAWWVLGAGFGYLLDSSLFFFGVFTLKHQPAVYAPAWIFFLWLLFCASFSSMEGLKRSKWLMVLTGGLGGPLAYWLGEPLGLIQFAEPQWQTMLLHGGIWALLFPALFYLRDKILKNQI